MILIAIYLIAGVLAYYWLSKKTKEGYYSAEGMMLLGDIPGLILCVGFWPVMIPLFLKEGRILEKEKNKIQNKEGYIADDLNLLCGKIGIAITPQSPSGKVSIEGKEYESRSVLAHISSGKNVRVIGHSMGHLEIEPADQGAGINSVTSLRDSTL